MRAMGGWVMAEIVKEGGLRNNVLYTAGEGIEYGLVADVAGKVKGGKVEREIQSHNIRVSLKSLAGPPPTYLAPDNLA